MSAVFPSPEWVTSLSDKLNGDKKYAQIAHNWEGDLMFFIEAGDGLDKETQIYLDLWHGKCRDAYVVPQGEEKEAAFILQAAYGNFSKVLTGKLDPMQAMMTRKLKVKGSMGYMMRNVPTVLEFVRCAQEITDSYLGQDG